MVFYALFTPTVASRRYGILEKRPPIVSADAQGGGAKGGTENVHSFVKCDFFLIDGFPEALRRKEYFLIRIILQ